MKSALRRQTGGGAQQSSAMESVATGRAFGYSVSLFDSSLEEGERRWGTLQKIKPSED